MKILARLFFLMVAISLSAQAQGPKIQCWTDKNGNRMCGDRVPPEYAGNKREVIKDGRVVETKRAAKTPEEIAEEERLKKEAEEAAKRASYDRSLLQSYRNVNDIYNMRDERLAMFDLRIKGAQKSTEENQKTLEDLRGRLTPEDKAAIEAGEAPADKKLAGQISQYEEALAASQKSLARLKDDRAETEQKYDEDAKRYLELRPPKKTKEAAAAPAAPASAD